MTDPEKYLEIKESYKKKQEIKQYNNILANNAILY
jgi:hypothetical protein